MSTEKRPAGPVSYGYETDEVKVNINPFEFGLNAGVTYLKEFKYIPNGGKDGAEQDALEIIFVIAGTEKSARMFPVTKAFDKNGGEITDPNSKEIRDAMVNFNAMVTHILKAFVSKEVVATGLAVPVNSFKEFIDLAASLLPKNYPEIPLDIFFQWGWQIGKEANQTYLELPKKMNTGYWLVGAQPGTWTEKRAENISEKTTEALWYENEKGDKHPFIRNGWFMLSPFAEQQKKGGSSGRPSNMNNSTDATANTTAPAAGTTNKQASGW